MGEENEKLIK